MMRVRLYTKVPGVDRGSRGQATDNLNVIRTCISRSYRANFIWRADVGVSKEQAVDNRRAIVAAAAKLFRERGVDGVGIAELMKAAGFTQGGFYNHFKSKEALVAEVIAAEMSKGTAELVRELQGTAPEGGGRLERQINKYLSKEHRLDVDGGCPVAGFSGDTPRLSEEARSQFAVGLDDMITIVAGLVAEAPSSRGAHDRRTLREQAISLY